MKLIKQSYEIIDQTDFSLVGIKKHIERCARVSYKSEDKITEDSYEKFVNMLINRGHDRPLEFGTVHLKMPYRKYLDLLEILSLYGDYNDIWLRWEEVNNVDDDTVYMTTNYRYYLELCKYIVILPKYFDPSDSEYYPKRHTVHMILDRGVMDEFRTHVGLSHLAESTRYCNYSKDKFNNELTFVQPCWVPKLISLETLSQIDTTWNFYNALQVAEYRYLSLLDKGWTPQQARSVLPLSIKSELISCGFEDIWENFFKRRDAKDAHPMAQEIAKPMHEEFIKLGYVSTL